MSGMFNVFHVSLLKRYKDGCRGAAAPPAVLDDGEVHNEVEKIVGNRAGRRTYCVRWRGLPPHEDEWLPVSKLRNAAESVQDYLDELHKQSRPAARVGRPESAVAKAIQDTAAADNVVTARPACCTLPAQEAARPS